MSFRSINPFSGELFAEYPEHSTLEIESRLAKADTAFKQWKKQAPAHRVHLLNNLSDVLLARRDELAVLATTEMGKTVKDAKAEVEKCALNCRYYADNAEEFLAPHPLKPSGGVGRIEYDPLGNILAVMPWNFPFWQVVRCAAPIITAGNTMLLKHASNVQGCAFALKSCFVEAGYPDGCFQVLAVSSSNIGAVLADHRIAAATLTGSESAGKSIASIAGQHLKKVVLELGGSDPFIVLPDADFQQVAQSAIAARCVNNGQSCIAAKRFLVPNAHLQSFAASMHAGMSQLKAGNPMLDATQMGPLARPEFVSELAHQVRDSVEKGAHFLPVDLQGNNPERFAQAGVLISPPKNSRAYSEELFGPVAILLGYENEEEAIFLANETEFGLGASIWGTNIVAAENMARQIDAGCVYINTPVSSQPAMPFGGTKLSGFGRELSFYGILEFTNPKTIFVKR